MNSSYSNGKYIFSKASIALIIILCYLQTSHLHAWKWGTGIIYWDTISYYSYLPALFIHHDLSLEFIRNDPQKNESRFWPETTPEGKLVIKTTNGLAYLYFPFFIIAHLLADPLGYEADGFSEIYQITLAFSPLFYFFIGLIFLRKILKKYFTDGIVTITLLSVGLASNLFYYSSVTTISHTFSFCLISLFLYNSLKWIEYPNGLNSLFVGLLLGIISLIRPTNSLIAIFPLLFGIRNLNGLRKRIQLFIMNPHLMLIIFSGILILWLPQFLYWKQQTGHYFYYSYYKEEHFFWTQPAIFRGLFGFRKGWLIYSPVMVFSLIGIGLSYTKRKDWFYPLIIILPVSLYIMLCWWCWWYCGGFGLRPIIDYYALLSVPLALSFNQVKRLKSIMLYFTTLIIIFFFYMGIFHHFQAVNGAIHWDSMSWNSYKYNFGHIRMTEKAQKYLVHPDYNKALMQREWE